MGRPKSNNVQINISIPMEWKKELENIARIYSVEEGKTITFLDLMRRGIQEKYQLGEQNDEQETLSNRYYKKYARITDIELKHLK